MSEAFNSDNLWKRNIEQGSEALLKALWREHPRIMRVLGAKKGWE